MHPVIPREPLTAKMNECLLLRMLLGNTHLICGIEPIESVFAGYLAA